MSRFAVGQSAYVNPKQIDFVQPAREKYFYSDFRKIMILWRLSRLV
jgi:hypothetical protein